MNYASKITIVLILYLVANWSGYSQSSNDTISWYGKQIPSYVGGDIMGMRSFSKDDYLKFCESITISFIDTLPVSTLIPDKNLRGALKIINNLRTDSIIKDRDMRVLQATIKAKDQTLSALRSRIETYRLLSDNYKKEFGNLSKQNELKDKMNNDLSRQVRKEKTKTVIAWITGAAVTTFTLYLTTK